MKTNALTKLENSICIDITSELLNIEEVLYNIDLILDDKEQLEYVLQGVYSMVYNLRSALDEVKEEEE